MATEFVLHQPVLVMLVARHAHADDEVFRHRGANRGNRLAGEAQAVLEGAAIAVGRGGSPGGS